MEHRARDCACDACAALGRVASTVVDEDTGDELRQYIAKVLERSYTKILEKGLAIARRDAREGRPEAPGHRELAGESTEPPVDPGAEVKEEKTEAEEEATKKRKRRKRRPKEEEEVATREEEKPAVEEPEIDKAAVEDIAAKAETPGTPSTGVPKESDKDPRTPLPRSPKPSANPSITLKEKKTKGEVAPEHEEEPRLRLRPKAKGKPTRLRSRSRGYDKKDKKKRRSPSPTDLPEGGDGGVSSTTGAEAGGGAVEEEGPPGNWEVRPELPRRPKSPDHPPPLPRRPNRGQLWIGPIRAYKNRPPPKKNKGVKKDLKNQRYWERRRQQAWEDRHRAYRGGSRR